MRPRCPDIDTGVGERDGKTPHYIVSEFVHNWRLLTVHFAKVIKRKFPQLVPVNVDMRPSVA